MTPQHSVDTSTTPTTPTSGIDFSGADQSIRPQDDLFGHVNGGWIATAEIPADKARYGTFERLRVEAQEDMRDLLEEVSAQVADGPHDAGEQVDAAVGALYRSMLDESAIAAAGLAPLHSLVAPIAEITDQPSLFEVMGRLQRSGVKGAVWPVVSTDDGESTRYVVYLEQAGLSLPDESYYREDQHAAIRDQHRAHVVKLLGLAEIPQAARVAEHAVELESRLARGHWDRVRTRDSVETYTKVDRARLDEIAPDVPWDAWIRGLGAPDGAFDEVIARQPSFLTGLSDAVRDVPLEVWTDWLTWHVVHAFASYLPEELAEEDFAFFGKVLTGTPEIPARWKRATDLVDSLVGQAAGRLYVERHFAPASKERMVALVANLVEAYRRDITNLAWMSPDTRQRALDKLDAFTPKIAYPDQWRDYSGLVFDRADLVGNVARGVAHDLDRDFAKLGGPIDRSEWFMTPQTVNAYYNPGMNEIVFPAAILQPPFFDPEADDAANYGAIGSVIGHEIGHGFDDQGSRYDGTGNLNDWWTADDRSAFDALTKGLIAQYDGFEPRALPGEKVNGALTVGENIGDLGGLTVAHLAYLISLDGQEAPVIDGLTGPERFFFGWAQVWRLVARPEEAKRLLTIDPHSPGEFRANIVRNLTEFYEAFDVKEGDALWLPEDERIRIW